MDGAARAALRSALIEIGAEVTTTGDDTTGVNLPNGRTMALSIVAGAVIDATRAARMAAKAGPGTIVVADLIGAAARRVLDDAGVSWLDRRGQLRISTPDVWIDRDIDPLPRSRRNDGERLEINGVAAFAVAAGHLIDPDSFGGVRSLARLLDVSPSAISQARRPLADRGLLTEEPGARADLFWALSAAWRPEWHDIAAVPPPSEGIVAAGTSAAAALGAPIIATGAYPVELHAVDVATLERLRLRAGSANDHAAPARVSVAPSPLVTIAPSPTVDLVDGHRVAHPLFVALDLAADPARGGEALVDWDPQGWTRAW